MNIRKDLLVGSILGFVLGCILGNVVFPSPPIKVELVKYEDDSSYHPLMSFVGLDQQYWSATRNIIYDAVAEYNEDGLEASISLEEVKERISERLREEHIPFRNLLVIKRS